MGRFFGGDFEDISRACDTPVVMFLIHGECIFLIQLIPVSMPTLPTYTQSNFDQLCWHDCPLHGIRFETGPEAWDYRMILDIDYMTEWVQPTPPEQGFRFKIAPADWIFENVDKLHIDIAPQMWTGHLGINRVVREWVAERPEWGTWQWTIELHAPSNQEGKPGRIQFCAPEMKLQLRKEPILHERQELEREMRG